MMDVERALSNEDKPVDIIARWGPLRDQVRFYLRKSKLDQVLGMYNVSYLSVSELKFYLHLYSCSMYYLYLFTVL